MKNLLLLISLLFFVNIQSQQESQVADYIKHANTHYWLGRHWKNDLNEFQKAKIYLNNAKELLDKGEVDSSEIGNLSNQILVFNKEINEIESICIDNMNGRFPLYMNMMGYIDNYEMIDDPFEISCENVLGKLLELNTFKPSKPLKDLMNFAVLEIRPYDPLIEEVCAQYINNNSNTYVISRHEIASFIDTTVLVYSNLHMIEIAKFFDVDLIGKYKISALDQTDKIYFTKADFEFIDPNKGTAISKTSAESVIVDKTGVNTRSVLASIIHTVLYLLILSVLLFIGFFRFQENKWPTFKNIFRILIGSLFGYALSVLISFGLILLCRTYAPDPDIYYITAYGRLWHVSIALFLGLIAPVLSVLLIGLLTKKIFLSHQLNTFVLFAGVFTGTAVPSFFFYYQMNEILPSESVVLFLLLFSFVSAYYSGVQYFKWDRKGRGFLDLITVFLFIIPVILYHYIFIEFNDHFSINHIIVIASTFVLALISYFYLEKGTDLFKKLKLFSDVEDSDSMPGNLGAFSKVINDTIALNDNAEKMDFQEHIIEDFKINLDNCRDIDKIGVVHIEGPRGIGKTTMLKEFFKKRLADYPSEMFFYGDCDEFKDGNTIPYEPFAQAFAEFLGGEGVFKSGATHAKGFINIIKPGLKETPIGSLALSMINTQSFDGATTKEICRVLDHFISEKLNENSQNKVKSCFYFILEDIQWIDKNTIELFRDFIKMIYILKKQHEFDFILVVSNRLIEEASSNDLKDLFEEVMKFLREDYHLTFKTYLSDNDHENAILVKENFCEQFLDTCGVEIHFKTKKQITSYFNSQGFNNPSHILECLNYIVQHQWMNEENGELVLNKVADLRNLPLPSQLKQLYAEKFEQLDNKLKLILETASFVGESFEANTLAKIWKVDRLELLHMLRTAEDIGFVRDVSDKDDVYKFTSKRLIAELRKYASRDNNDQEQPQIVKEYHKMITNIMIEDKQIDPHTFDLNIVCQLADRTFFTKDQMPDEAFRFNYAAAIRCLNKLNTQQAKLYAVRLKNLVKEIDANDVQQLKVKILSLKILIVKLSASNFEEALEISTKTEELFKKLLSVDDCDQEKELYNNFYMDMLQLHYACIKYYRDEKLKAEHLEIITKKCNHSYPLYQNQLIEICQNFYHTETFLFGPDNTAEKIKNLNQFKVQLEESEFDNIALYGRVLNSIAGILNNKEGEDLWIKRFLLILELNKIEYDFTDVRSLFKKLEGDFPKMDFQSKLDVLYTAGAFGRHYCYTLKDYKTAIHLNRVAKEMNLIFGDYEGYSRSGNAEGICYNNLFKEDSGLTEIFNNGVSNYVEMFYELENEYDTIDTKARHEDADSQWVTLVNWMQLLITNPNLSEEDIRKIETPINYFISTFVENDIIQINRFYGVDSYLDIIESIKKTDLSGKSDSVNSFLKVVQVAKNK